MPIVCIGPQNVLVAYVGAVRIDIPYFYLYWIAQSTMLINTDLSLKKSIYMCNIIFFYNRSQQATYCMSLYAYTLMYIRGFCQKYTLGVFLNVQYTSDDYCKHSVNTALGTASLTCTGSVGPHHYDAVFQIFYQPQQLQKCFPQYE